MHLVVLEYFKPLENKFSLKDLDDVLVLFDDNAIDAQHKQILAKFIARLKQFLKD